MQIKVTKWQCLCYVVVVVVVVVGYESHYAPYRHILTIS